jgi:hypothetical protein
MTASQRRCGVNSRGRSSFLLIYFDVADRESIISLF